MNVDKMSVSFASDLGHAIRAAASEAGQPISTWLSEAAAARLRSEALSAFLAEWEQEHGALTAAELAHAEVELRLNAGTPAA